MALGAGGTRLIIDAGLTTVIWDAVLDVARATLPLGVEHAALPGKGEALFVVKHVDGSGAASQRFVTLREEPSAIRADAVPGAPADVYAPRIADGLATFLEYTPKGRPRERPVKHQRVRGNRSSARLGSPQQHLVDAPPNQPCDGVRHCRKCAKVRRGGRRPAAGR